MPFDSAHLNVTDQPTPVAHPDKDLQQGYTALCRCDAADVLVGGDNVSVANGYPVSAGTEFGFDSKDGVPSVIRASGSTAVTLFVLWGGV